MQKGIRLYLYADVEMINSFFSQLYPDIKSINISKSKDSHANLNAKVELPAILQGFLKGNFSGEYGRDRGYNTSIKVEVPLEEKIKLICSKAVGTETSSIVLPKQNMQTLILGSALIINETALRTSFLDCFPQTGFNSLDEFYDTCLKGAMAVSAWEQITLVGKEYCHTGNQTSMFKLVQYFDIPKEGGAESFLILDSSFPIRMFLSPNKLLVTESTFRAANLWRSISKTNALGVLYKLSSQIYSLKPLALWTIVDYLAFSEGARYRFEHFMDTF